MLATARASRLRIAIGISLILAVCLTVVLATRGPAAGPAGALSQEWLRDEGTSTCYETAIVDYYLPPTLEMADSLPEGDRWLNEGSLRAYVGNVESAAVDLDEPVISRAGTDAWITGKDARGPVLYRYQAVTTPKGRTVWLMVSEERPQSEAACN